MVYAGLKYLLPLKFLFIRLYTALLLRPSARFAASDHNMRIWKKWKPSLGLLGTVQLLMGVLGSFYADYGSPPSLGRDFYPDGPAAGIWLGRAVFLDRGKNALGLKSGLALMG